MKIIQITAAYKPAFVYGGPTMSVAKLCEELIKSEVNVDVLTTTANGKDELAVKVDEQHLIDEVPVNHFKRLTKDHTHFSPALLTHLTQKIKSVKRQMPNTKLIIHIHAWWNLVSILSCLVAYWHKVPVILSPRGMLTNYTLGNRNSLLKSILHRFFGKKLLAYCHIHATSEKEKKDVLQNFKVKDVTVIANFVRFGNEQKQASNSDVFKLLFLSRIEQKKGLELLFDGLSKLKIPWQLDVAGAGESAYIETLKRRAESLKITSQVNWLGQIENEVKFRLLADSDLLALTSYNENFANVVIESLSVGTPVLITNEVGLADYVAENDFGWICELNPESIASQIKTAFNDIEKRQNITSQSLGKIRNDFDDKKLVGQYLKMYNNILNA